MLARRQVLGYNSVRSGSGSVRLEHSVRDREVEGSNPFSPTEREKLNYLLGFFVKLIERSKVSLRKTRVRTPLRYANPFSPTEDKSSIIIGLFCLISREVEGFLTQNPRKDSKKRRKSFLPVWLFGAATPLTKNVRGCINRSRTLHALTL